MEPKFQTSFIPQKPIAGGTSVMPQSNASSGFGSSQMSKTINIFNTVATVAFVLTVLACGGLFAYKQYMASQIAQESASLTAARSTFDFGTIQNLITISSRVTDVTTLLNTHVAVSELFNLLQSLTVQKVTFTSFSYTKKPGELDVSLTGESQGYDVLAAQANIFADNSYIQNPVFSDFDLAQNGDVTFKLTMTIDPTLISYKQAMAALYASNPVPTPALATSTATTTTQ